MKKNKDAKKLSRKLHYEQTRPMTTFDDRVEMLNLDQRRIFEAHLLHQVKHESRECSCTFKPLRMFVSGVG